MKITVKEFVKLDLQGLMKVNGGEDNTINNPGTLDIVTTPLPETGLYGRLNFGE